jgi:hypothetical protein
MAPEQAKGKPVDRRADIYAFGAVLYEMITGERLHRGEMTSDVLASVITEEPQWDKVPRQVQKLLRRCLEKDPQKRLRHIGDVMALVEENTISLAWSARRAGWLWPAVAGVFLVTTLAVPAIHFRETRPTVHPTRFQIPLPDKGEIGRRISLSPDGRRLAFTTTGPEGGLWVRDLDSLESRLLPSTQNAEFVFWSPDSRFIVFGAGNQLRKVDASGGPAQTLCDSPTPVGGGAWNQDGVILFGSFGNGPLRRVSAAGGVASDVTALDTSRGETNHATPTFLPDGRHFVYGRYSSSAETDGIFVGSLDLKPQDQSRERLLPNEFGAVYADGRLFFMREGTLMAQTFDSTKLDLAGEPVPVAQHVGTRGRGGFFSASANGTLAYRTEGSTENRQPTWFDRQGKTFGTAGEAGPHASLSLSPDGTRAGIIFAPGLIPNAGMTSSVAPRGDIWLHDFACGVSSRFTFDGNAPTSAASKGPIWSPDGSRIVFIHGTGLDLYEKPPVAPARRPLFSSRPS